MDKEEIVALIDNVVTDSIDLSQWRLGIFLGGFVCCKEATENCSMLLLRNKCFLYIISWVKKYHKFFCGFSTLYKKFPMCTL